MNPLKYAQMMKYLTRAKKANPDLPDVFPASKAPIPPVRQDVEIREAINKFSRDNPRTEKAGGGMLVQPGFSGVRQGYAGTKKTKTTKVINKLDLDKKKIKLNGDNFITGEVKSYAEGSGKKYVDEYLSFVDKNYLKNDMSMVEPFQAYIKNKYPKKFSKIISDVNQSGYRGLKDISTTYKKALANELITAANNQIKYVDQFDILKKLVSPTRAAAYEKSGGLSARPPEWADKNTLNNFKNLDKMENKLSKALTYMVKNNVTIIDPKKVKILGSGGKIEGASPIKKMMHYLAGGGSQANLNKALEINPWYQSQNFKVGGTTKNTFDYLSKQYGKDFIGQPFNDAYDFALQRRGRITLKGMSNQPLPENLIWEFAARSAQRNFTDGVPIEQWPVKILDKKGNVVDLGEFPVDSSGRKILNTSELQFEYNGKIFNRNNLKTTGVMSGNFDDIYKISRKLNDYLTQEVPDPDNPKKTISLGELFRKTEGRIFPTIGHDDARGGVKKRPFNSFKILTNVENLSLFNAYNKIKNPQTRRNVVDFIYGETKGLRGDRYKEAWTNKNVNFVTEYIKTGQGLEQTPYKQAVTMPPKKLEAEILKKMGFKCKFAASTGGAARCDDPASYTDDINKTRQDLNSNDVRVRAAASAKLNKGLQVAKTLPQIGTFLRRVGQATVGGVAKALEATGIASPVGVAIEGMVEGGIYDYFRKQGYTHDQAYQETFFPGIVSGRPEGVPWYGGAESLLEKELVGDEPGRQFQPKVAQYVDALKDQEQVFDAFGRLEQGQQASRKDITDAASADIQDLNRSGTISNINRIMNPESMASQAYQTAVETQAGRQDQRARDYMAENYVQTEPTDFAEQQLQKKRNEAMLQMFPTPTVEDVQNVYKAAGRQDDLKYFQAQDYKDFMQTMDDFQKQSYFADNFRLEKAGGGIAKLAGVSSGPPPESGPNSQGLQGLMKRVRNL